MSRLQGKMKTARTTLRSTLNADAWFHTRERRKSRTINVSNGTSTRLIELKTNGSATTMVSGSNSGNGVDA